MDTKEKILEASLFLFNRFGFVNVRLQHIADELSISTGNLAYHFKSKDQLLEVLYAQIKREQHDMLAALRNTPIFINTDRFFEHTFMLQERFSFFYTDTLEVLRAYPEIRREYRAQIQWFQLQLEMLLQFNQARGVIIEPAPPDSLLQLAYRWLMLLENWVSFERTKGTAFQDLDVGAFKDALWALLAPHFTENGRLEFMQLGQLPFDSFS